MYSVVSSLDQATDVSLNIMTVPEAGKPPGTLQLFSPQMHCMQVCSNQANPLSNKVLSAETRPLSGIPAGGISGKLLSPLTSLDAAELYHVSQKNNAHEFSTSSVNLVLNQFNSSCIHDKIASGVDPSFLIKGMNIESRNSGKALSLVKDDGVRNRNIVPRSLALTKQEFEEGAEHTIEPDLTLMFQSSDARARAATAGRIRRTRIASGIKSLQNCIPYSDKHKRESALDNAIDYIKFLKLQVKVLSQSRLNGEATPYPFVYLEGFGHYFIDQKLCGEPLEEVMGQLIESNMEDATELLKSKGLAILPMALACTLPQTT